MAQTIAAVTDFFPNYNTGLSPQAIQVPESEVLDVCPSDATSSVSIGKYPRNVHHGTVCVLFQ
jgi:hypothetical protein